MPDKSLIRAEYDSSRAGRQIPHVSEVLPQSHPGYTIRLVAKQRTSQTVVGGHLSHYRLTRINARSLERETEALPCNREVSPFQHVSLPCTLSNSCPRSNALSKTITSSLCCRFKTMLQSILEGRRVWQVIQRSGVPQMFSLWGNVQR